VRVVALLRQGVEPSRPANHFMVSLPIITDLSCGVNALFPTCCVFFTEEEPENFTIFGYGLFGFFAFQFPGFQKLVKTC
jgi:hypothetical protein